MIHVAYMIYTTTIIGSYNSLLNYNIVIGILTSIVNHKTTSNIAKWTDRCAMILGVFIDIHLISQISYLYLQTYYLSYYLLLLSIISFILSKNILTIKKTKNNRYSLTILCLSAHITSHLFLTLTHLNLLYYYSLSFL